LANSADANCDNIARANEQAGVREKQKMPVSTGAATTIAPTIRIAAEGEND
jgi:hypothetical protein